MKKLDSLQSEGRLVNGLVIEGYEPLLSYSTLKSKSSTEPLFLRRNPGSNIILVLPPSMPCDLPWNLHDLAVVFPSSLD